MLVALGFAESADVGQVTDIVTAMILRQLLERLMGFGVVCVMTSKSAFLRSTVSKR